MMLKPDMVKLFYALKKIFYTCRIRWVFYFQGGEIMTEKLEKLYEDLSHFFSERKFADLRNTLLDTEPADIASFMENNLEDKEQIFFFRLLPKELASDVFIELDTDTQEIFIKTFNDPVIFKSLTSRLCIPQ